MKSFRERNIKRLLYCQCFQIQLQRREVPNLCNKGTITFAKRLFYFLWTNTQLKSYSEFFHFKFNFSWFWKYWFNQNEERADPCWLYFKIPPVMHLWKTSQPVHFTRSAENFEFENIVLISRCEIQKGKNKTPKYNVDARCHPHGWEGGSTIIWTLILEHLYFVNLLLWFSNSARVWPFPRWVGRQEGASSCFKLQNQTSASF